MRDALGGSVALVIIVVFIVIALGYMAFNVNYTKAFRMKNKIISVYEEYDGICGKDCENEIIDYAKSIGYNSRDMKCPTNYTSKDNIYGVRTVGDSTNLNANKLVSYRGRFYHKIITKINIDIPVINNIMDLRFFYITGDTKTFTND